MLLRDLFFGRMTDNGDGTCFVTRISTGGGGPEEYDGVPTPNIAGAGSAGVFISHGASTMVLCASFDDVANTGEGGVRIISTVPDQSLYESNNIEVPADAPLGSYLYPACDPDDSGTPDIAVMGPAGASLELNTDGDIDLRTSGDMGLYVENASESGSMHVVAGNLYQTTESKTAWSGRIQRFEEGAAEQFTAPTIGVHRLRHDFHLGAVPGMRDIGVFRNLDAWMHSKKDTEWTHRNPHLAESVCFWNEFSISSAYSGADDEPGRYSGALSISNPNDTGKADRSPGNVLYLNENRIACSIKGNVVCPNGYQLDINLNPMKTGDATDRYPGDARSDKEKWREIGERTRRGIASFFQVGTNASSTDPVNSQSNFVSSIDKEGAVKITIPKTSHVGNILYASNTDYVGATSTPVTSFKQESSKEPIPVTLRGVDGVVALPAKAGGGGKGVDVGERYTGIEFYNANDQNKYFPSDESSVKVNLTAHHNMCATAERLISNITTRLVSMSRTDAGIDMNPLLSDEFLQAMGKPSQWPSSMKESDLPRYMSYAVVTPQPPAINPGGEKLVYCGNDQQDYLRYSNAFTAKDNGDGTVVLESEAPDAETMVSPGGYSANINLEGCLITSIGKTDYEGLSFILDTAGSIIARMGRDENGRSMIIDTDGDLLLDVGGVYSGTYTSNSTSTGLGFLPGRFEMRVNVADFGHVNKHSPFEPPDGAAKPSMTTGKGDFFISISKEGLMISGSGGSAVPMIIKNDGAIDITCGGVLTIGGALGTNVVHADGFIAPIGKPISH